MPQWRFPVKPFTVEKIILCVTFFFFFPICVTMKRFSRTVSPNGNGVRLNTRRSRTGSGRVGWDDGPDLCRVLVKSWWYSSGSAEEATRRTSFTTSGSVHRLPGTHSGAREVSSARPDSPSTSAGTLSDMPFVSPKTRIWTVSPGFAVCR